MVTQLAREAGAYIIGTGRAADRQTALDFGAQEFVDLDNDALEDVGGVDLVFDVIGGDIGKRSTSLIRTGGTLVTTAGPPRSRPAGRQGPRRQSTRAAHGIAHRDRSVEDWPPDRRSQDRHPLRRGDPPDTSIPPRNSEGSILGNQGTAAVSDDNARLVHREAGVVIPGRNHRDMDRGGGPLHTPSLYRNSKDSVSIGSRLSASRGRPCW
jgi:hypothetical protein